MYPDEIVIKISKTRSLLEAVCMAMNTATISCSKENIHRSVKPSINEDEIGLKSGESAYMNAEWKSQINVMLG